MNKLILIPVIGVVIISLFLIMPKNDSGSIFLDLDGFTYYDIEKIQNSLKQENIIVSTPVSITDYTLESYCPKINGVNLPEITYCTTTSVIDSDGNSIGNINFGGTPESTFVALAIFETESTVNSDIPIIFETMIKDLVCDCWGENNSTQFPDISSWLLESHKLFNENNKPFMKSTVDNLSGTKLILEITKNENTVTQTLLIIKKV